MVLVHAIHVDEHDIGLIRKAEAGVAYNPMANDKGATGIAPAWQMYRNDVRIGLGTDGPMSSNQVDLNDVYAGMAVIEADIAEFANELAKKAITSKSLMD